MNQDETNQIIEGFVKSAEKLRLSQLDDLICRLRDMKQQRLINRLPADEAELIEKLNNWLPADTQEQLSALIAKRDANTLNPKEQTDLTALLEKAKEEHNKRVEVLTELASLRGISLTALMNDLGVRFPDYI
jgi:hypothetical protein